MTAVPGDTDALIDRLAGRLAVSGALTQPHWHQALRAVPRHLFVPAVAWAEDVLLDRKTGEALWLEAVYSDIPLVTQIDDGTAGLGTGQGLYSSSCSAPSAVTDFLERLDPQPGDRVLEIGTGTGWTAGLLSWRVGPENVTSIEVDGEVAGQAAANLKAAGYAPSLVTADGADGWPEGAPYDRVHGTCAVRQVPYAWAGQCRPGSVIVTPVQTPYGDGHLVKLAVLRDGTAAGHFECGASYMMMRSQRWPGDPPAAWIEHGTDDDTVSVTPVNPRVLAAAPAGACLAISGWAPGIIARPGDGALWLLDATGPGGSWACASYDHSGGGFEVQQCGARRLWDEAVNAYFTWLELGRPGRDRFGLTVTSGGQRLWLDHPGNPIEPAQ